MTAYYMVLDLRTNRIIRDLSESAMLVTLKVLSSLPDPNFEVVRMGHGKKKFVTLEYTKKEDGSWEVVTTAKEDSWEERN